MDYPTIAHEKRNEINGLKPGAAGGVAGHSVPSMLASMDEHDRLTYLHYAVDADRIVDILGFPPSPGPWMPLQPSRHFVQAAGPLVRAISSRRPTQWTPTASDLAGHPGARNYLAFLYGWFNCFGATRCLVPLDYGQPWPIITSLITNAHLPVKGAPPLPAIAVEFIGKTTQRPTVRTSAPDPGRALGRARPLGDKERAEVSGLPRFSVDSRRVPDLLGFTPAKGSIRLPLKPVFDVVEAAIAEWAERIIAGEPVEPAQVRTAPEVATALSALYAHLVSLNARRCPMPVPVDHILAPLMRALINDAHLVMPGAPRLSVVPVFIGKVAVDR